MATNTSNTVDTIQHNTTNISTKPTIIGNMQGKQVTHATETESKPYISLTKWKRILSGIAHCAILFFTAGLILFFSASFRKNLTRFFEKKKVTQTPNDTTSIKSDLIGETSISGKIPGPTSQTYNNLKKAIQIDNIPTAQKLLKQGADVNATDPRNRTALHYAASKNKQNWIEWLAEQGADLNATTKKKHTPLMIALKKGHIEVAKKLIEKGADLNIPDAHGYTALHYAAAQDNKDYIELFLNKGVTLNQQTTAGETPLILAIKNGHMEVAKKLIENGADVNIPDAHGHTPIYEAAVQNNPNCIEWLFQKGADLDTKTNEDSGPYIEARTLGNEEAADKIVQLKTQTLSQKPVH